MQSISTVSPTPSASLLTAHSTVAAEGGAVNTLAHYQIIRRNGAVVPFEPNKIAVAMMKAFLAVHGTQGAASASVRETVDGLTQQVDLLCDGIQRFKRNLSPDFSKIIV